MRLFFTCLPLIVSGLLAQQTLAQAPPTTTLSGRVFDAASGKPMPFATVFINNTTRGTTADSTGHYQLTRVPIGSVEIVASFVGYRPTRQIIRLGNEPFHTISLGIEADKSMLADVSVTAKRSKGWERQFRRFKDALLGETPFTSQCLIINTQAVQLTEEKGHLKAKATEPLIIENRALGYQLRYQLLYFDAYQAVAYYAGTCQFDEMKPDSPDQAERWQRNRQQAYEGSTRHLLASMIAGRHEQEGFMVYRSRLNVPRLNSASLITSSQLIADDSRQYIQPLKADTVFRPGELPFERELTITTPLEVFHTRIPSRSSPYRDMPYAYSLITLPQGTCTVTTDGWVSRPNGMEIRGHLGNDRLASLLPADWRPTVKGATLAAELPNEGLILKPDRRLDSLSRWWNQNHHRQNPTVFLHTDKPLYATGDQLWLSAYVLDAVSHQPQTSRYLDLDDALHVDLISPQGRVVQHQWVRIQSGRGASSFFLSDTLQAGLYRLRAYTEAERVQAQPAYERIVAVYNFVAGSQPLVPGSRERSTESREPVAVVASTQALNKVVNSPIDIQFLPEGGRWISTLPTRLGLKAQTATGRGAVVSGRVVDDQGKEVAIFNTNRLGMGSIELTPEPGRRYSAEVRTGTETIRIDLPKTESEGLALMADVISDSSFVTLAVRATGALATHPVYITVQSRGQLLQQTKIQLQDGKARLVLLAAKLPPGLCQINLFDIHGRPWAERLVFISERLAPVQLALSTDQNRYQPRQTTKLQLTLTDGAGYPLVGSLSASVLDADQTPSDTTNADLRTHLLLTGDLRGRVEEPGFYLQNKLPATRRALDDLLLTQGWRRLNWAQTPGEPLEASDTLSGLVVSGRVIDKKGKPVPNAEVLLTSLTPGKPFTRSVGADNRGFFRLGALMLTDTIRVMAQAMDYKLQPLKAYVVLDKPEAIFKQTIPDTTQVNWGSIKSALEAARLRQEAAPGLYRQRNAKQLKEVIVKAMKQDDDRDNRRASIHGTADVTVPVDDNMLQYGNIYEMMMGRVPGVQVLRRPLPATGYSVIVRGVGTLTGSVQPLYLVDGVYFNENEEGNALLTLDLSTIERIEVIKNGGAAMYGARGGNGVIAIYTKKKPARKPSAETIANEVTIIGFPTRREFYVPRFDDTPESTSQIDRRDILYWQPILQTDTQGQAALTFPLSDIVRTIRVNVQGITSYGRPISIEKSIRVQ